MSQHLSDGGTFIMEVSSHAIKQGRVAGIDFEVRCLTNISQDHLDYHSSFDEYKQTKSFIRGNNGTAIDREVFILDVPKNNYLRGHLENLQASKAILLALKIKEADINRVLSELKAPPGRFEFITGNQPFDVVIDYAHTPDSLQSVLKRLVKVWKAKKDAYYACLVVEEIAIGVSGN